MYKITCVPNNKVYVGITGNLKHRLDVHFGGYKLNTLMSRAIKKYGKENFVVDILETVDSWEEAHANESYYIKKFNSHGECGYNMTDGGEGMAGLVHSEETRKRMSLAHVGKNTGEKNPMWGKVGANKGKKFSEETRRKIAISKIGKPAWNKGSVGLQNNPNKGKFLTLTDQQIHDIKEIYKATDMFQKEIAEKFNTSQSVISNVVKNCPKKRISERTRLKMSKAKNGKWGGRSCGESHPLAKLSLEKVFHIRDMYSGGIYSQDELAKKFGVSQANISSIIKNETWVTKE